MTQPQPPPPQKPTLEMLLSLSTHYDTMLVAVTSIWLGAGLVLLGQSFSNDAFHAGKAVSGIVLTVCAHYFVFSFRRYRRQVHEAMPGCGPAGQRMRDLLESRPDWRGPTQWDVFSMICCLLLVGWAILALWHGPDGWKFLLVVFAAVCLSVICCLWCAERHGRRRLACRPREVVRSLASFLDGKDRRLDCDRKEGFIGVKWRPRDRQRQPAGEDRRPAGERATMT